MGAPLLAEIQNQRPQIVPRRSPSRAITACRPLRESTPSLAGRTLRRHFATSWLRFLRPRRGRISHAFRHHLRRGPPPGARLGQMPTTGSRIWFEKERAEQGRFATNISAVCSWPNNDRRTPSTLAWAEGNACN